MKLFRGCSYKKIIPPRRGERFQQDPAIILIFANKKVKFILAESFYS